MIFIADKKQYCVRIIYIDDISSKNSTLYKCAFSVRFNQSADQSVSDSFLLHQFQAQLLTFAAMAKLNIVVIGAGLSGLCSAKYAIQAGHSVTIYEQTSSVGGTWNYTDEIGTDGYGIDIHTSMYHGLR